MNQQWHPQPATRSAELPCGLPDAMDRPGRFFLRLTGLAAVVLLVFVVVSFMLLKLGAAPSVVLLGGPDAIAENRAQLAADYGLDQPAIIQLIRYAVRTLTGEFGRSWLSGDRVAGELLRRIPATLELMTYSLLLGALIGIPAGIAAGFNRGGPEDRTVRGAGILGEAMPAFLIALLLLLVFFRWLDIAPAPAGRISVVLTPPLSITGSYFIDAVLTQDSVAARSALGQLMLPVLSLSLLVASALMLQVRGAILTQLHTAHLAYARAQGMSHEMLTAIALRGAVPAIWASFCAQFATLIGTTAVVEYVFAWGGVGQYGLDAMVKADFAAVQGFILLCGVFAVLIHLLHGAARHAARIRIRRA